MLKKEVYFLLTLAYRLVEGWNLDKNRVFILLNKLGYCHNFVQNTFYRTYAYHYYLQVGEHALNAVH